ncbi:hypothetical protein AZE42_05319 [Rhizopogon vesiculosus]|uniref:Uncharacterized protein n=1 Tax=Rhizopogon vesiculosus TaxID=180088 RepID=A0A1J8QAZ0_9AGAM|nr:hypothetical protein AZE42_05319 [Rhizopogon vesiculosus]
MLPREPYKGSTRKLVLAFDVGTTFTGISYCILDPGEVPVIRGVSRYPAQEQVGGDSKIPSIIYYDLQGDVRAVGAEALQERIIDQAEDEGWMKLEWWKLHLRAEHLASSHIREDDIPPLPRGKSAVQVLADFMRYLFQCARTYIQESHLNLWRSVENSIEFVLTHPNGWEGPQQQQIRRAAELAGLISCKKEQSHVHLLTEGEASLHFCVTNVIASNAFSSPIAVSDFPVEEEDQSDSQGVVIVDAGGGTIDLSAYSMKLSPTSFEEIAPAQCCLQGSVFVTRRAHNLLQNKLSGSNYSSPEMIIQMTNIFDKTTKLRFRKPDEPSYVKFGTIRDKDLTYDIRSGQLKLAGQDVADLFDPSVEAIIDAFEQQIRVASTPVNGTQVSELREFRSPFSLLRKSRFECNSHSVQIICYKGDLQKPKWLDIEPSSFSTLCTVHADLSELCRKLRPRKSAKDQSNYYLVRFEVVILFGQTELKAQISWKHKGVEMRSPASIVYDE